MKRNNSRWRCRNGDNNVAIKKQKEKKNKRKRLQKRCKGSTQELFFQASSTHFINFKNCRVKFEI